MMSSPVDSEDVADGFWADPRAGALIELAEDRQLKDDHEAALELLDRAIAIRSPESSYAMAARAQSLFQLDRQGDARAQMEVLRKHQPFSAIAFHRAAEAAETSGDMRLALRWFDMALSRCTDQLHHSALSDAEMAPQVAMLAIGRWRVRRSMNLPVDELDKAGAPEPEAQKAAYVGELPAGLATSKTVVRVLFWPRDQILSAAAHWPTLVQDTDFDMVVRRRELDNRRIVSEDGARIVMVPLTVESMIDFAARVGGDALDPMTRTELLHERHEQGIGIPWPPARNSRCWCGSQLKYKKCCGGFEQASVS